LKGPSWFYLKSADVDRAELGLVNHKNGISEQRGSSLC